MSPCFFALADGLMIEKALKREFCRVYADMCSSKNGINLVSNMVSIIVLLKKCPKMQ